MVIFVIVLIQAPHHHPFHHPRYLHLHMHPHLLHEEEDQGHLWQPRRIGIIIDDRNERA
jgi:hypothetical protein